MKRMRTVYVFGSALAPLPRGFPVGCFKLAEPSWLKLPCPVQLP